MQQEPAQWHLDKRVPISIIIAMLLQTVGMVWWAASLSSRVEQHGREINSLVADGRSYSAEASRIREVLARLDERMAAQTDLLRRVENALQRRHQ